MKKLNRIIVLVTLTMFLLSITVPSAFAATKEEAFSRLNALSVAVGDASGNPQYDKTFTRAEAAAIMVNLSGMKAAIDAAKGATKFKDVSASHWASGVVNLAVGSGIIKGYPDGTYKPDKEVSYAELSAMLVGVLGYTPKLQGVWPSNVIGKAAQLGLLDGVNVTDYNAAAVRSNVFLAADNALDTKPLKETKDGYTEDDKVLMASKLSVTKMNEGTVTEVPMTSGTKNKVKITYATTPATSDTFDVLPGIDVNRALGLKVEAWVKDDKVFFLNVKTAASDIITSVIKSINDTEVGGASLGRTLVAGDVIKTYSDKQYTVAATSSVYFNYKMTGATATVGQDIKMILGADGKAEKIYIINWTKRLVDRVDTTNETITFKGDGAPGGSIALKDKVCYITKNGSAITLADVKQGDIVDYYTNTAADTYYIVVTTKSVSGKLTSIAEDGLTATGATKFKIAVDGKDYKFGYAAGPGTNYVYYSTDDGKNYSKIDTTATAASVLNQNVKLLLNRTGTVIYINAGAASSSGDIVALVKYTKVVDLGEPKRYIYVAKSDGTNTYYEVTKDTRIDNIQINEDKLKAAVSNNPFEIINRNNLATSQITKGMLVKLVLASDGKVDNIKQFAAADTLNDSAIQGADAAASGIYAPPGVTGVVIDKTADAVNVNATGAYAVNADTKIFKVKSFADPANLTHVLTAGNATSTNSNIEDVEMSTWPALEAMGSNAAASAVVVKDAGVAKYIVIYNDNTGSGIQLASDYKYGALAEIGYDGKNYYCINEGSDTAAKKELSSGSGSVQDLVRFKITGTDKFNQVSSVQAESTGDAIYAYFKIVKINSTEKQLELKKCDAEGNDQSGQTSIYKFYNPAKVKVFDISTTNAVKYLSDANGITGYTAILYNAYDADGNDIPNGNPGGNSDSLIDYIFIKHK